MNKVTYADDYIDMNKETNFKAVYYQPEVVVANLSSHSIICTSPGGGQNEGTGQDELEP